MKQTLLKLTQKITTWHEKMFTYLTTKSKTSIFFTWLLVFLCLYEIFEHIFIPLAFGSRIYKTILTSDDYDKMMEKILETDVQPYKKETLQ